MKVLQTVIFILTFSFAALGQNQMILSGVLVDEGKAAIPNTTITATDKKGNQLKTVTDQNGFYELALTDGIYKIEADTNNPGFEKLTIEEFNAVIDRVFKNQTAYKKFDIVIKVNRDFTEKYGTRLFSDSIPGTINVSGSIYDQQGAVILGTKITFKSKQEIEYIVRPNMEGNFSINLPVGIYQIEATANGFRKFRQSNYRVVASHKRKMFFDIVLEVGEPSTSYAPVWKDSQNVESGNTKISNKILQRPLEKLPKAQNKNKRKNTNNKQ